ncbi:MAG: hypothetical protein R3A48_25145 [Polyangiales bacterium]
MTELLPDVGTWAERILDELRREPGVVYVDGGVGSGRGELVRRLGELEPRVRTLEFLQLTHADATSTAFLECSAMLPAGGRPRLETGSDAELHRTARRVFRSAGELGLVPVLRVPESWEAASRARPGSDAGERRGRHLLDALTQSGCTAVVVADAALSAAALGIDRAHRLPPHVVPLEALGAIRWREYGDAFETLLAEAPPTLGASPFAWRLAVGAVALGARPDTALAALRSRPVLPAIAGLLATQIQRSTLDGAVAWMLALRRPLPRADILGASGVDAAQLPLLTDCIGYGEERVRVASAVRAALTTALGDARRATVAQHDALAARYERLDGLADPSALAPEALQAWCEKVHHAAHGSADSRGLWSEQALPSPELYWDRARRLSVEEHDFQGAAEIYRRCVTRFPDDDYGWQYLAFNLQRSKGARAEVEGAFRRSVALAPENPWWNARLVSFLIDDAQPGAALREWDAAVDRIDVDGSQSQRASGLAESFHDWIAEAWHRAGRTHRAAQIMGAIPAEVLERTSAKVRRFAEALRHEDPAAGGEREEWATFLQKIEARTGASAALAHAARTLWADLRRELGPELPEPAADLTADRARFQFSWSYATLYVEIEIDASGGIVWFARDRLAKTSEGVEDPVEALPEALLPWLRRVIDG